MRDANFIIKVFKLPDRQSPSIFYFIISSKISKKATKRNRIRRILKEYARVGLKNIIPGLKIIVILQPNCIQLFPSELRANFLEILKSNKIQIVKPKEYAR